MKIYYRKGTCSLAALALSQKLEMKVDAINAETVENYKSINPTGSVPFLIDGDVKINEGAAIALYLLQKSGSPMLPKDPAQQAKVNNWMMFANATMHPSYSPLFALKKMDLDEAGRNRVTDAAIQKINSLWEIVENQLGKTKFVAGDELTMADLFLTVYSRWNKNFGDKIKLGEKSQKLVKTVSEMPFFIRAEELEKG